MPRNRSLEDAFERLGRLRTGPVTDQTLVELREALRGKSPHLAARAAEIAGELGVAAVVRDLAAAFERLLENPVKSDPGCVAKTAIVEALDHLGARQDDVFLRGIRTVQLEPVWGGKADTAVALRGSSAFALVNTGCRDILTPLAELLADPEARARAAAARAIAAAADPAGIPVLRLKALVGDAEPEVLSECFGALLQMEPEESIEFVGRFLAGAGGEAREAAALALGSSRRREAFPVLRAWWEVSREEDPRRTALLAIAMLKLDEALAFLLSLIAEAPGPTARLAITALEIHRYDDALVERIRAAARRDDADLRGALRESFPPRGD